MIVIVLWASIITLCLVAGTWICDRKGWLDR